MASIRTLAKDTAIYGMSSIVGRFLNYLLVPLYSYKISVASGGYGVITEIYSYVALLLVLLTFGMETTFFRFVNKTDHNPQRVYSTTLIAVGSVALAFTVLMMLFLKPVSGWLDYGDHPEYVGMMVVCVAIDAFLCIPYAYLRYKKKAMKFALTKLVFIFLNIGLNLFYFFVVPLFVKGFRVEVGYVFGINLACSVLTVFVLYKELTGFRWVLDRALLKRMLCYAWPILVLGIAGILNQTADKMIFPRLVEGIEGKQQLAIYGACFKIAMIMAMITQAFRYAYEPFVFGGQNDRNSKSMQAEAMKYFVIFTSLAFVAVMAGLDLLRYLVAEDYWAGLRVVPIVMAAEIMMGIYFNLSFWYKLIDRTIWGAWFSGAGCLVLIIVNVVFIPRYGYMACAWAGVAGYATAMVLSYVVGQRYYRVDYPLKSIAAYVALTAFFSIVIMLIPDGWPLWLRLALKLLCFFLFLAHAVCHDVPREALKRIAARVLLLHRK